MYSGLRISTAFSCILLLCIYSQTSKIHSGSGGGQRTKTVSSFYSLEFSTTSSHAGEIGSDVISEKSLPFERQTQRVSPPCLACLLSLIFFCVVCLLGQQMGTSHYHRSQFPLTDLTAIFSPFLPRLFPLFAKGNRKTRKSLWEFQRGFLPIYLNYASFMALLLGWQSYLC